MDLPAEARRLLRRMVTAIVPAPVVRWEVAAGGDGLEGRTIVVVGAAGRLGPTLCRTLLAAGAEVWGVDRDAASLDALAVPAEVAPRWHPLVADVSDEAGRTSLVEAVDVVDGLVLASIGTDAIGVDRLDAVAWRRSFENDVVTPALVVGDLVPALTVRPGASVVALTSVHAERPSPWPAYGHAKSAQAKLVDDLARDLASRGVRVNAVVPSLSVSADASDDLGPIAAHPLGAAVVPAEAVAQAVLFLLDARRSPMTTGQHLLVDGGSLLRGVD